MITAQNSATGILYPFWRLVERCLGYMGQFWDSWYSYQFRYCPVNNSGLVNCTFDYCKFEGCFIKYNDLLQSLSKRPNIRWELCKNLSLECLKLGHEDEYRKYYFEEKEASEQYYWKKFWHKGSDKYYRKYNAIDQLSGLGNYILSKANKILWGYGEKLTRLIFNVIIVLLIFMLMYYYGIEEVSKVANRRRKVNKGPDEKKKRRTIQLTDNG